MAASAPGRTTTRAAQAAETRQRLVDAAIQLFSDRSYEAVAVADIAKAAGVAHGLLFHYFGNKRGIYSEAVRYAAEQMNEAFAFQPGLPPLDQIRGALASHLRYLAEHRGLALRLVLSGRGADPQAWAIFEAGRWSALGNIGELVGVDMQHPALRMAGRAVVSAIDEATVFWLENGEPFEVPSLVNWMIEMAASAFRSAAELDPDCGMEAAWETVFGRQS
ncbi:TetR family transcriptional regulator [Nocardia sp. NPDC005745]|uniref:TetR/AcrR family transcriptional regulator n=1 Tax=Nocardia sp. NPDC005745 TaxID=3157061 RepID=UPI0033CB2A0E